MTMCTAHAWRVSEWYTAQAPASSGERRAPAKASKAAAGVREMVISADDAADWAGWVDGEFGLSGASSLARKAERAERLLL